MLRAALRTSVVLVSLSWMACEPGQQAHLLPASAVAPPTDPTLSATGGTLQDVWILELPQGASTCLDPDAPTAWSKGPLFAPSAGATLPAGLQRFCKYTRLSGTSAPFASVPVGYSASPDRAVISPMGLEEVMQGAYQQTFNHFAGQVLDYASLPSTVRPRVALIDTTISLEPASAPWNTVGYSNHGHAMSNIVRALVCDPAGDCIADVATELAFDMRFDASGVIERNTTEGGDFASMSQLAQAIWEGTRNWEDSTTSGGLILNLSLGWLPAYGGDDANPLTWQAAPRAVYAAIYDARCRDALVVAAAGNDTGGPSHRTGGMLPAGWNGHTVTSAECTTRIGSTTTASAGDPLVTPAGGTNHSGDDLSNARKLGRPGILAYGDHATVPSNLGSTPTLTGTSVSAAVLSSAAAAVWAARPNWTSEQVIAEVRNSGTIGLPISADFCSSGPTGCGNARKISVCAALASACSPGACDATPSASPPACAVPTYSLDPGPAAFNDWTSDATSWTPDFSYTGTTDPICVLGQSVLLTDGATGPIGNPCPYSQFYLTAATPFADPQPHGDICPNCLVDSTGPTALLEHPEGNVEVTWQDTAVSMTLLLNFGPGNIVELSSTNLPDDYKILADLPTGTSFPYASLKSAVLSVIWNDGSSGSSDLAILN